MRWVDRGERADGREGGDLTGDDGVMMGGRGGGKEAFSLSD